MDKIKRAKIENGELEFFERKAEEFKFRQKHWEKKHKPAECPAKIKQAIKRQLDFSGVARSQFSPLTYTRHSIKN